MSVRILEKNFIDEEILANFDVSSEQAAFPAENAFNQSRRSKVWRSGGYWQIPADAKIVFRETGAGPDLTAIIAEQEVSGTLNLLPILKAALEAVGNSTYTVSIDSNSGKIKFASDLAGGGGVFQIFWEHADSLIMADILGFISDDTGASNYTADVLKIAHPSERFIFDHGIETNPRNFLVTGPRNTPLKLSPNGTYLLQANETNPVDWSGASISLNVPHDDEIMLLLSQPDVDGLYGDSVGYRYSAFDLQDTGDTGSGQNGNPNGYLEIGAFFLGDELFADLTDAVNRGGVDFGFSWRYVDRSTEMISEGGQSFSNIKPQTQEYTFTWRGLTKEQAEEITQFFRTKGTSKPFFIVFDPCGPINWTTINRSAAYVKFIDEPRTTIDFTDVFTTTMAVREEL